MIYNLNQNMNKHLVQKNNPESINGLLKKYLKKINLDHDDNLSSESIEKIFLLMREDFSKEELHLDDFSRLSHHLFKTLDYLTYEKGQNSPSDLNKILECAGNINLLVHAPNILLVGYLKAVYAYPNYKTQTLDEIIEEFQLPYPNLAVDSTLTPENASVRGYEWITDVMYDITAPEGTQDNLLDLIKIQGYKLGTPVTRMATYNHQGLYAPLTREK